MKELDSLKRIFRLKEILASPCLDKADEIIAPYC